MIEIIAGTFGYYNGRKVIPITKEDGPQQFDPELEARLVKQGVAKYVDEQPVAPTPVSYTHLDVYKRQDHIPGRRQHADRLHLGRGADQRRA